MDDIKNQNRLGLHFKKGHYMHGTHPLGIDVHGMP
jgi:hypothetical protein